MIQKFFVGLILIHGLMHLLGFVKASGSTDVSKSKAALWVVCSAFLFFTAILIILKFDWWWTTAFLAIVLSQILIVMTWQRSKLGTITNFIILLVAIMGFSLWNFNADLKQERIALLSGNSVSQEVITKNSMDSLPVPVKRWLDYSGVVGRKQIDTVYLKQKGLMKLKPDQKDWIESDAEQYFTVDQPKFIWNVKTSMMGIPVVGKDVFKDGQGSMHIKLGGLLSVVDVSNHSKINESTIQRYLGEIIWFPSAALSDYIKWEPIDNNSAWATMSYGGSTGSAEFHFDDTGKLTHFIALRYRDIEDESPTEWVATVKKYDRVNGLNIPTKLEISWSLEAGKFTWYKFEVYDVLYNN